MLQCLLFKTVEQQTQSVYIMRTSTSPTVYLHTLTKQSHTTYIPCLKM